MARYGRKLLVFLVIFSLLTVAARAAGTPTLRAESVSAMPGGEARVAIVMENNPGIICLSVSVGYDSSRLTLKNVSDGGILGSANAAPDKSKQPYQLSWENDLATKNYTQSGVLATLTFAVAADAPTGETPITLTFVRHSALTAELEERTFETVKGVVVISYDADVEIPTIDVTDPTDGPDATDAVDTADGTGTPAPGSSSLPTAQLPNATQSAATPEADGATGANIVPWIILIVCCLAAACAVVAVVLVRKKKQKHD